MIQDSLFDIEPDTQPETALLPTPSAGNFNDGEDLSSWQARQERLKQRLHNGNGMGTPLSVAVKLLPTPQSSDCHRQTAHPKNLTNFGGNPTLLGAVLKEPK